jgi:hypothetical protein
MRCHWIAACLGLCLVAATVRDDVVLPQEKDGVKGVLTVRVAEENVSQPAHVDYLLVVTADDKTDVKAELVDVAGAWKWEEEPPSVAPQANATRDTHFHFKLDQTKRGIVPLPDVKVQFRKDGQTVGDDFTWTHIFKESRDLPPPPVKIEPPQRSLALWWILGIVGVLIGLSGVALWSLWGKKPPPPLTPAQRALRELDRIEGLGLAGPDETGWYPAEVSSVVRRYLSERYGLPAQQQTTAEFLHTMRQTPELLEEFQQLVNELLERCDLAKFAALRTPPEECRRLAAVARTVVQQTELPKQAVAKKPS